MGATDFCAKICTENYNPGYGATIRGPIVDRRVGNVGARVLAGHEAGMCADYGRTQTYTEWAGGVAKR